MAMLSPIFASLNKQSSINQITLRIVFPSTLFDVGLVRAVKRAAFTWLVVRVSMWAMSAQYC